MGVGHRGTHLIQRKIELRRSLPGKLHKIAMKITGDRSQPLFNLLWSLCGRLQQRDGTGENRRNGIEQLGNNETASPALENG